MTPSRLQRPRAEDEPRFVPDFWVDEAIWGHRLHDEQTPWLAFLEFLVVLDAEEREGRGLRETTPNTLSYSPPQRLWLRNVLFNNPRL